MDIYVRNKKFERIAVIEDASVIWVKRYYDVGDFEVYVGANEKYINILQSGNYVERLDDDSVGIIENIKITYDDEGTEYLTATGRFAESILERRIVWEQTQLSGTAENGLRNLINNNIINPTIADRKIPIIELGNIKGYTDRLDAQYTGNNILEINKNVAIANQTGFKFNLIESELGHKFTYELYKGIDRSYNQTANPYVVFSDKYDNLLTSEYEVNTSNLKNVALVAGEGEGTARKTATVGSGAGLNRYEVFVDARDLSTNSGEISTSEYNQALNERGLENIVTITQAFTGEVDLEQNYKYKKDFFLGDIVTIENSKWGIFINSRIIEITESEDENGYKITPTFGI